MGGGRRTLRGREQLDAIVRFFDDQFDAIRGSWHAGDNLNTLRRTRNPLATWTAEQARRHGYTIATRDGFDFLPGTDDGMGDGECERAEFLFGRVSHE